MREGARPRRIIGWIWAERQPSSGATEDIERSKSSLFQVDLSCAKKLSLGSADSGLGKAGLCDHDFKSWPEKARLLAELKEIVALPHLEPAVAMPLHSRALSVYEAAKEKRDVATPANRLLSLPADLIKICNSGTGGVL